MLYETQKQIIEQLVLDVFNAETLEVCERIAKALQAVKPVSLKAQYFCRIFQDQLLAEREW